MRDESPSFFDRGGTVLLTVSTPRLRAAKRLSRSVPVTSDWHRGRSDATSYGVASLEGDFHSAGSTSVGRALSLGKGAHGGNRLCPPCQAERAGFEPATHLSAGKRFPVALIRPTRTPLRVSAG